MAWKKSKGTGGKKLKRRIMGWARPKICPSCRQFTRQEFQAGKRVCLCCGYVFEPQQPKVKKVKGFPELSVHRKPGLLSRIKAAVRGEANADSQ
jgi:hypothetical protein